MFILQKIFFPFGNNSTHHFLLKNVWFRTVMVLFIGGVILAIPSIWITEVNSSYENCVKNMTLFDANNPGYWGKNPTDAKYKIAIECNQQMGEAWTYPGIISKAIILPFFIFYLGQFLFFIIGVNFIYLGSKRD